MNSELDVAALEELRRYPTGFYTDTFNRIGFRGLISGLSLVREDRADVVVGRALTVRFMPVRGRKGSTLKLYDAIYSGRPGDVLVIEAPYAEVFVGDLVATCAQKAGFAGILVDGSIRDHSNILEAEIPIWRRSRGMLRPGGFELASIGEPVVCGGAQVHSGDIIVADSDGAAVLPPGEVPALLTALRDMAEIEAELHQAIEERRPIEQIHALFQRKAQPVPR